MTTSTKPTDESVVILSVEVNGVMYTRAVPAAMTLLSFLREELHLTGTKNGCDAGSCGCCTVLFDGQPVLSCLLLAAESEGHSIGTIEGIAQGTPWHPVQQAMVEEGAVQCGYCTPSMVLHGVSLLLRISSPSLQEIREAISGTVCRCTGYTKIEKAIQRAAQWGQRIDSVEHTIKQDKSSGESS